MVRRLVFGGCSCWHSMDSYAPWIMDPRSDEFRKRGLVEIDRHKTFKEMGYIQ